MTEREELERSLTSNGGQWPTEVILRVQERRYIRIRAFYARLEPYGA